MGYKDKEKQREFQKEWMRNRRNEILLTLGNKCAKCGSVVDLEIDHQNREEKTFHVNSKLSFKRETIEEEVKKCQLLCRACHKDKTRKELGYEDHNASRWKCGSCRCDICKLKSKEGKHQEYLRSNRFKNRKKNQNKPT